MGHIMWLLFTIYSFPIMKEFWQELIRRWDTRTWRDRSQYLCLPIYHWTTTHLYFRNIPLYNA